MIVITVRPLLVPCSSRPGGRPAVEVLVRSSPPYGDEHHNWSPTTTTQDPASARPRDEHWHYPNPHHPATLEHPHASHIRKHPCPHCGAPIGAQCITRNGQPYDGNHRDRSRVAAYAQGLS